MIITEDEAKTKACPKTGGVCEATGCMAWRWKKKNRLGFCGVAGKPASLMEQLFLPAVLLLIALSLLQELKL